MRYALNNGSRDVLTMTIDQGTGELSFTIEGWAATESGVIKFVEMTGYYADRVELRASDERRNAELIRMLQCVSDSTYIDVRNLKLIVSET